MSRVFLLCTIGILIGVGCEKSPTLGTDQARIDLGGTDVTQTARAGAAGTIGMIRIGEVATLTGPLASPGVSTHRGIQLALDEVNAAGGVHGRRLELVTLDDQGHVSEAVLAMNKLISQEHVHAILGEGSGALSLAKAHIAQQDKVPMISPFSVYSKLTEQGDFIFRICWVEQFEATVMAEFAFHTLHARKVAVMSDLKSDSSRESTRIFSETFKKLGGEIQLEQNYNSGDQNFQPQLTAIQSAHSDLILAPGSFPEVGWIAQQKKALGIQIPMLGGDEWDSPQLREKGKESLDGSYFVGHFSKENPSIRVKKFVDQYRSAYRGEFPDGKAALGYDAALVLADAFKRAESTRGLDVRDAIAATQNFVGVTGQFSMGPDRNVPLPALVFRLENGGQAHPVAESGPSGAAGVSLPILVPTQDSLAAPALTPAPTPTSTSGSTSTSASTRPSKLRSKRPSKQTTPAKSSSLLPALPLKNQ